MKIPLKQIAEKFKFRDYNTSFSNFSNFKYSGFNLINEVEELAPTSVLDVGCGYNHLKDKIPNLIGMDVIDYGHNDLVGSVADINFDSNSFNVILVLGAMQYAPMDDILLDLKKITQWLSNDGVIVMRVHIYDTPDLNSPAHQWSMNDIYYFSDLLMLKIIKGPVEDINDRYVWWWAKQ